MATTRQRNALLSFAIMDRLSQPLLTRTPEDFRAACDAARAAAGPGSRIGLVPTMGALHEGHLSLVRRAREGTAMVAVTIFVNPTQFGPSEDLDRYPRDLEGDIAKLAGAGAGLVFAPEPAAMYPEGEETRVRVGKLADALCGPLRPGHFEGVLTVVAKLFALAGPAIGVFGRKDFQQLTLLRRMARDLFFPVEVVGVPIAREVDGLALSSRNAYLSPDERVRARALSRGLAAAWKAHAEGERRVGVLRGVVQAEVAAITPRIDYVMAADPTNLATRADGAALATGDERLLLAIAAHVGTTRLLDNVVLGEDPSPLAPTPR